MSEIVVTLVENVFPSFTGGKKRCFRHGSRAKGRRVNLPQNTVQLVPPSERWDFASVFSVEISSDLRERWPHQPAQFYIVAKSVAAAESYLQKRYSGIAKRHMGMARTALSEAMGKVSTRPANGRIGAHALQVARRNVMVRAFDRPEGYEVEVYDDLVYAAHALASGRAGVDRAMKLAANRIAGRLRNVGEHIMDEDLQTPFPDVQRKGKRSA